MSEVLGVAAEPCRDGSFFLGPQRRLAWSPTGQLSSALGCVVAWDVAAHPWDPWPIDRALPPPERQKAAPRKRKAAAPARPRRGFYAP